MIKSLKKSDSYKGKGIRERFDVVHIKAGKQRG